MALNGIEMYTLAYRAEFRQRVEMLSLVVAGEVFGEDINALVGGIEEHNLRFALAQNALNPTDELVMEATRGLAVNLRDQLTTPDPLPEDPNETLESRLGRLAIEIPQSTLLTAIRTHFSTIAGFDTVAYIYNNP